MADKIPTNQMTTIFGKPGEVFVSSYNNEEKRIDDLKITDYRKMVDNDGLIQMLWNAITNTIMSAGFKIEDDEDIETEESSEEKKFIEKIIFTPEYKGGMSIPFEVTTRTMLRSFIEGYRVFEVVWKLGENNKFIIDKLAPRAGKTDSEFYLLVDENGNFIGFKQKVTFMNSINDITLKNEGAVKKVVKATYGEEFGSNYGRSGLKAAWYHYDKAHKGMYLNHVGHELGAVKYRNFKHNLNDDAKVKSIVADLGKIGIESVGAFNKNDGELFFEDVADAAVLEVGRNMIILHYSMIAKSLLAQFIDLGSNGSSGNRALGETQTEFFKQGLQSIATIIIENTWNQVIADLIKVNFNKGIYPKFCVNPIDDKKSETILSAFTELVKQGALSSSIMNELQSIASEKLDLDVTEEQIIEDMNQKKIDKETSLKAFQQSQNQSQNKIVKPIQNSDIHLEDEDLDSISIPIRALFPDENKVRLADIKRKLINAELNAKDILRIKLEEQKNIIVDQYISAMRSGKKALIKTNISLEEQAKSKYSEEIRMIAEDLLNYGKVQASNELNFPVPVTLKTDLDALTANISLIISDQENKLNFRLKQAANNALSANLPENQTRLILEQEFETFSNSIIPPTVHAIVPTYLNKGRDITFAKYQDKIFAYRYTAILDSVTTEYCREMDGRVFQRNDPEYVMVTPPNHYGCRSIWTPILESESEYVNVNGKPDNLPIFGSLNTFKDTSLSDIEKKVIQLINQ
jgi:hypothetical protein